MTFKITTVITSRSGKPTPSLSTDVDSAKNLNDQVLKVLADASYTNIQVKRSKLLEFTATVD